VDTNLRRFRREDADQVVALALQAYARPEEQVGNPIWASREELESEISDWDPPATETLVVADDGAAVVGVGGVEAGGGSHEVADLFGPVVAKRAQGRRLGSLLLAESIALARAHGASVLDAAIGTRNRRGRVLLERNGFSQQGSAQAFYALHPQDHRPAAPSPAGLTVREAGSADEGPVFALYGECFPDSRFPEDWLRAGLEEGSAYLAELDGRPVAFLTIDRSDRWIYLVGVTEQARGRGIGGFLLSRALEAYWAKHPGEALGLATGADNTAAIRLYRGQGFRPTLLLQPYELEL
jgi:ribosomal protein S18 acetylase RimI-like enzyme